MDGIGSTLCIQHAGATRFTTRPRMHKVQVREPMSCGGCRSSARSCASSLRTAAAANTGRQQRRGRPGQRIGSIWAPGGSWGGRKDLNATRGRGVRTCLMRSGRLRGSSDAFIRSAQSTGQRKRCRKAIRRTRGIRGCVQAFMQRTGCGAGCAGCAVAGRGAGAVADPRSLQEVVGIVSAHHRETAAGLSGWTFEMICAACQSSEAALDVTVKLVSLILSGELPRQAFLLDGLLIGFERPRGGVRPIAISETWYRFAGVCALRT